MSNKRVKNLDYYILVPAIMLMLFGIVNVFSASSNMASGSPFTYLLKQCVYVTITLGVSIFVYHVKLSKILSEKFAKHYLMIAVIGLIIARLFMPAVNGAHGWIILGVVSIQPAEFAKLGLIIYFAKYFSQYSFKPKHLQETIFVPNKWILPAIILFLIAIMPDIGNLAINLFIILVMILASEISWKWAALAFSSIGTLWITLPLVITQLNIGASNYGLKRLVAFVNPWKYEKGSGTQLINSYYAISNGGLFGVGLGNSIQKTGYLPEPNTDFIMAVVAEEWGAIGILVVLTLLLIIIYRIIVIGVQATRTDIRIMMYGLAAYLTIQILVNIGGVSGVLPITGVTFPFISYGGSSTLMIGLSMGMALNASSVVQQEKFKRQQKNYKRGNNGRI